MLFRLFLMVALLTGGILHSPIRADESPKAVRCELCVISLDDASLKQMPVLWKNQHQKTATLDAATLEKFNDYLRTAKKGGGCEILSRPTIETQFHKPGLLSIGQNRSFLTKFSIVPNGEDTVFVPNNEPTFLGTEIQVTPYSEQDGLIRVGVHFNQRSLQSENVPLFPITMMIKPKFSDGNEGQAIPFTQFIEQPKIQEVKHQSVLDLCKDQLTLIHLGNYQRETRTESDDPVLVQIPFLNYFARCVEYRKENRHLIVAIKPSTTGTDSVPPTKQPASYQNATVIPTAAPHAQMTLIPLVATPAAQPAPIAASPPTHSFVPTALPLPVVQVGQQTAKLQPTPKGAVLKVLLEQYEVACKNGDSEKAKAIAAHCLELDPTCFMKK